MGKIGLEVFGLYATATSAEIALDRLIAAGYKRSNISLLMTNAYVTRDSLRDSGVKYVHCMTTSNLIGGTLGTLDGIGSVTIEGIGPMIAAGRMMRELERFGTNDLVGALTAIGIPDHEANRYAIRVKDGDALLAVHCDGLPETPRIRSILKESDGESVAVWGNAMSMKRWHAPESESFASAPQPEVGSY